MVGGWAWVDTFWALGGLVLGWGVVGCGGFGVGILGLGWDRLGLGLGGLIFWLKRTRRARAQTKQAGASTRTNEAGGHEHAHKRSNEHVHTADLWSTVALDPVLMVCTASLEHWFVKASTSGDDVNGGAAAVWYKTM